MPRQRALLRSAQRVGDSVVVPSASPGPAPVLRDRQCRGCWAGDWGRGLQRGHVCVAPVVREPARCPGRSRVLFCTGGCAGAGTGRPQEADAIPPAQEPPRELVAVAAPAPGSRGRVSLRFPPKSPCIQPRTVSGVRVQRGRNQGNDPAFHRPPAAESQHKSLYTWVPESGINLHADRLLGRVFKKKKCNSSSKYF